MSKPTSPSPTLRAAHQRARWLLASCLTAANIVSACAAEGTTVGAADSAASARHTYYSGGVHNDKGCLPPQTCIHRRKPGEPSDPHYPQWWTSKWTMYRVFSNYDRFPPPYASPPSGLDPADYQASYGASYYDATYLPPDKDGSGAMMERYEKFCLPIFPSANNFSCAFVSLGNKAYFLRFEDRPPGTPACCQFSLHNHPPTRDFIKHLPYNAQQSTHLGGSVQAYSRQIGPQKILFGYAFEKQARSDEPGNPQAPAYRHPQSFFFSGSPTTPPDAPIVSQNYTDFRADQPDPRETWDKVAQICAPTPGWCCLFAGDCPDSPGSQATPAASWADMDLQTD